MLAEEDGKDTYLNQLDGRNLLVVSVSHMSEAQLLYSPDIFRPLLNAVFSNASPGLTVSFFEGEDRSSLKDGVKTYRMAPISPLYSRSIVSLYLYSMVTSAWGFLCVDIISLNF